MSPRHGGLQSNCKGVMFGGAHLHVFTTNNRCNRRLFPKLSQWWTIYPLPPPPIQCRLFWELVENLFIFPLPTSLSFRKVSFFIFFFFFILLQPTFPLKGLIFYFLFFFSFFNALPISLSFGMGE